MAMTWSRLPAYDAESEAQLRRSQHFGLQPGLGSLLAAPFAHPLPEILARVAVGQQLSQHLQEADREASHEGNSCVISSAVTPSGNCNFFAPVETGLGPWRRQGGIFLEDQIRAFRPVTDQKTVLFRLIGNELIQVTPEHSHLDVDFGATEPACLAHALLAVIAQVDLPDFDIVLNHGDLPLLRKTGEKPPFYGPMDREARAAAPLFSICASADFWDILFPNVCRPALVNMSEMSPVPWQEKKDIAFWRGTDRGAVNWAIELRDMYSGSPRKRFLDGWSGDSEKFDLAFLEDDLLNATVVNTDPNFVPLDSQPRWRYLLDLPGNGYSGSLKQKLTSTSAVLLLTDMNVAGAKPVHEHYHAGLKDLVHVLRVTMHDAGEKVAWARDHDKEMETMVHNANEYMRDFNQLTHCYLWRLLTDFAGLLRYRPILEQTAAFGKRNTVRAMRIHRRPLRAEAKAFRAKCERLLERNAE
eukprot:TRINITY_DN54550_c0_g1_i1.p1 TRINITY_DN54550_c0_g1~~TRINITY_DN54550_c0_g1_i1.p1  ORF type:complete len:481 (-),score=78.95 TRINITY_DN54550_c0_g1_i1:21-1433(-)